MWTAPVGERFDVLNGLVGFGHMSGLFARRTGGWPWWSPTASVA